MKLKLNQSSTQQQISEQIYRAEKEAYLKRPNRPTVEAIEKAKFIDKTYKWAGAAENKTAKPKPTN